MSLRRFLLTFALFILTAVVSPAATPESSGPAPDVLLKNLYKVHDARQNPFFDAKKRPLLAQYLTPALVALIAKDQAASQGEVGAYDFDPLYFSQDPEVKNFAIGEVSWSKDGSAVVIVTFKDGGKSRRLPFAFQQQKDKTWRISDITYPDGSSLAGILKKAYPAGRAK